jgi:hypothetical protein
MFRQPNIVPVSLDIAFCDKLSQGHNGLADINFHAPLLLEVVAYRLA